MRDFSYFNPTRLVLGRGKIAELSKLVPLNARVLVTSGGGSIKRNGVRDQVLAALAGRKVREFEGIEPNPEYATLLRAVEMVRSEGIDFLLSVGGGSVLDGTKFVAAAARYPAGQDPWQILLDHGASVKDAVPVGCVLTLPATGSEANPTGVISRRASAEKYHFGAPCCFPVFSILDPATTFSLPRKQVVNGIVDAYTHVIEQYATTLAAAPLQDRQAEAVLSTLVEQAPAILAEPPDFQARATFMWCATQALNTLLACGVDEDWATHMIGHELTALYGLDHAVTLAIILPGALRERIEQKRAKLTQYGKRVFGVDTAEQAIDRTEAFFRDLGMRTRLSEHGIDAQAAAAEVDRRFTSRGSCAGERGEVDGKLAARILLSRA
ncbi:MAG TPA: iron-containing alcohol dehydrogenase [Anaeromyxobacter sp.]|nr:iron-containing alcohol dehydrogenase [Anaeromyxobacter sp.]